MFGHLSLLFNRGNDPLPASLDARQSRVVELHFFSGLNVEETAEVLHVSEGKVRRDWSIARAWLDGELSNEDDDDS